MTITRSAADSCSRAQMLGQHGPDPDELATCTGEETPDPKGNQGLGSGEAQTSRENGGYYGLGAQGSQVSDTGSVLGGKRGTEGECRAVGAQVCKKQVLVVTTPASAL